MEDTGLDNAPTRPPSRSLGGRPPKGPRLVARSKSDAARIREHLGIAAQLATPTRPDVAETLLGLRKEYRPTPRVPEGTTNVTLMVPKHLRKAVQDAAVDAAAVDSPKVQELLGAVVSAGIPRVLAGELAVREIPRDPRGTSSEKVNLNIAVDSGVLEELREALPALGERLGFAARASIAKVALRLLLDEYGLDYEAAPNKYKDLAQLQLHVPPRLAEAIVKKLDVVGADLRGVVEEGYTKVLAGTWRPLRIPKAAKGSDYERDILPVRVDGTLIDQVRAKCPDLKAELGFRRVTPPTIAIDYLISELGLDDLANAEYGIAAE